MGKETSTRLGIARRKSSVTALSKRGVRRPEYNACTWESHPEVHMRKDWNTTLKILRV